jgi:hypothetical protein
VAANYIDPENFLDQLVEDPGDINAQKNIAYLIDQHTTAILALAQRIQREAVEACCDAIEDRSRHWEGGHKVAARKLLADLRATPPTEGKGRCRYCGTNGDHYCPNDIGTE